MQCRREGRLVPGKGMVVRNVLARKSRAHAVAAWDVAGDGVGLVSPPVSCIIHVWERITDVKEGCCTAVEIPAELQHSGLAGCGAC